MLSYNEEDISHNVSNENLKLKFHARFLTFIFSIGIFMIFIVSFLSIKGLKNDFDNNFPEPLNEISLLNNFQSQYMLDTINILQSHEINKKPYLMSLYYWRLYEDILHSSNNKKGIFVSLRKFYQTTFLTHKFLTIKDLHNKKNNLIKQVDNIISLDIEHAKINDKTNILKHAKKINELSANIINTKVSIYAIEKETTDYFHNATINMLCAMTLLVFCAVIYLNLIIVGFIGRLNEYLKKLFDNATKELRNLNLHLKNEIQKQVETMREKDNIMQAQSKLASMGEMLQNIAHQWRQPLNSIILIIQGLKSKSDKNTLTKEIVKNQTKLALNIAQNMSATIENFRNFFRLETNFEYFYIKEAIKHAIELNQPTNDSLNIKIHLKQKNEIKMFGNKNAFTQIILVLLNNAKDAFIERNIKNPHCFIHTESFTDSIIVHFYDNAGGINQDIISKVFEPYFTTKHKSVGTGVGLYMAREIITKHLQGNIEIDNIEFNYKGEFHKGALFVLKFHIVK